MAARSSKRRPEDDLAGPEPKPGRCAAKTARGTRCSRNAMPGAKVCAGHLRPTGRPTKLSREVTEKIVTILSLGGYAETAALAAGVSRKTFYEWLKRGDPDGSKQVDAPYREFREQVEKARAEAEHANVALVTAAAAHDWKAAAWLLERQMPVRWAGPRGRGITSTLTDDPPERSSLKVVDDQVGPDGRAL